MNIVDFIPKGSANAVTRAQLMLATGLDDRAVRDAIEKARENIGILNMSDGKGYFLPDYSNPIDRAMADKFYRQQEHRQKAIRKSNQGLKKELREASVT